MTKGTITLYHGSQKIVRTPLFGEGKPNNDYGKGFYCTESEELAKEWSVSYTEDGFANRYLLDTEYLNVLQLNSENYSVLNWMAILVEHRLFTIKNPVAYRAKRYLLDNFNINVDAYDLVVGYRADDSYYDFAESFLNNAITVEQLSKAMKLGKLGEQIVLKSQSAFSRIEYRGFSPARREEYYVKRRHRNNEANERCLAMLQEEQDGLFIQDIMRGEIKNDDPRIPRNIPV